MKIGDMVRVLDVDSIFERANSDNLAIGIIIDSVSCHPQYAGETETFRDFHVLIRSERIWFGEIELEVINEKR